MTRRWQGTTLFTVIMAGVAATVGGRLMTAPAPTAVAAPNLGSTTTTTPAPTSTPTGATTPSAAAHSPAAQAAPAKTTVQGAVEQTVYGPVQVSVTFSGSKITDVTALQTPNQSGRDVMIASYAVPQLRQEVLASQSAHVDSVSGATYTSGGYLQSVQSAIDAHH
ncbi:MAG: FMN-binding protein [Microbacteriaceae bacterium]|nr:FMN-binding protein [Microbacteriaceae bacterium]